MIRTGFSGQMERVGMFGAAGSPPISRDMDFFFPESLKYSEAESKKNRDFMDIDHHQQQQEQQQQQQQQQQNTGLLRYRSAPSSFFEGINSGGGNGSGGGFEEFPQIQSSSPEDSSETIFGDSCGIMQEGNSLNMYSAAAATVPPLIYRKPQTAVAALPPLQSRNSVPFATTTNAVAVGSAGSCSNLLRQSSSPPGLLNNMAVQINGFNVAGDSGFVQGLESSFATRDRSRMGGCMNSSKAASSIIPRVSEIGNLSNDPGFPWEDPSAFSPLRNFVDNSDASGGLEIQNVEARNPTPLAHHLSLPKSYTGIVAPDKLWGFQDSVPCRVRAKRGCATHPRSIAERMRRTRISERMRKLQELFPNMDKQTNTADMLEVAVEYIKDLQRQVKNLNDTRAACTCSSRERYSDPTA